MMYYNVRQRAAPHGCPSRWATHIAHIQNHNLRRGVAKNCLGVYNIILGLYRDNGKENRNYLNGGYIYIYVYIYLHIYIHIFFGAI